MTSSYLTDPIVFLIRVLFGFYALIAMLRFLLQLVRARYDNPISQFVVKATTPVLRPMRRLIPGYARMDLSALVLVWLVISLELALLTLIAIPGANPTYALAWAVPELVHLGIYVFLFAIIIRALLSWVNPDPYHPVVGLLDGLTLPLLRPARRALPPVGGLDLSPLLPMLGLVLLDMLLLPPLRWITGSPF